MRNAPAENGRWGPLRRELRRAQPSGSLAPRREVIEKIVHRKCHSLSIGISAKNNARPSLHAHWRVIGSIDLKLMPCEGMYDDLLQTRTLGGEFGIRWPPGAEAADILIFARTFWKIEKR